MAAETARHNLRNDLNQLVRTWDQRLRTQQTLMWLPRCLMPGLILGVILALISRTRPWLLTSQIVQITAVAVIASIFAMVVVVWSWPRTNLLAARRFDVQFGLKERVSTALELMAGLIHAEDSLVALQIEDAWATARSVQPDTALPFIWRGREWAGVLMAAAALALLLVTPNPQEAAIAQNAAQQAAVNAAAEEVRDITEEVASDPNLATEDRQQVLQALDSTQTVLNEPDVAPEEAFAALSDAQAVLEEKAADLNDQASTQQAALEAAGSALQDFNPSPPANGSPPSASEAVDQLSQDAPSMDAAEQASAAQALEQAASALDSSNPSAAQSLRDAAQSLREGDTGAAQQALQEAAAELRNAESAAEAQQSSAQRLNESAEAVGEAADQVRQQSQSGGQQGETRPNGGSPQQSQSGEGAQSEQSGEGEGQSGQETVGENGQEGQSGQPIAGGQQPGESGQSSQGGQPSDQGESGGQGQGVEAQGSEGEGQSGEGAINSSGAGAGDTEGGAGTDNPANQGSPDQASQDNAPDGQGEGQYDPVYAPQRIGGESDQDINLEPDASDAPVEQGEFSQNPEGNSTVPYDQVFSDYSDAANRALESDYIPLGMRDVVRNYFSSLEPGQGNNRSSGSQP